MTQTIVQSATKRSTTCLISSVNACILIGRDMPCFVGGDKAIDELRGRFHMELNRRAHRPCEVVVLRACFCSDIASSVDPHKQVETQEMDSCSNCNRPPWTPPSQHFASQLRKRKYPCLHDAQRPSLTFLRCMWHGLRRQFARHVDDMVTRSLDHWSTTCYDRYQRCMLGIM